MKADDMQQVNRTRKWTRVEVPCRGEVAEELGAFVGERFSAAVEITEEGIVFYLEEAVTEGRWEEELQEILALEAFRPCNGVSPQYTFRDLPDVNWQDRWKEHFKPLRVGKRFVVCPTWEAFEPRALDRLILLDPGRAFGTGHHETTRLCLEWLEALAECCGDDVSRMSVLDVGTGSGILAVASALAGFGRVVAVDNDLESIEVASENLAINRVADRVQLLHGTVEELEGSFHAILANIQAQPLLLMRYAVVQRLKEGGQLALSGLLVEQTDEVGKAYGEMGLNRVGTQIAGEWCLLHFEK
ncbi:MAG: 50S ribosomal protein L11 methyltransferase [Deltaproteobacteria bacterium]|nr:50S ribosomal protein L11 methyltransferase [Deltaproteobacteria bacterium]